MPARDLAHARTRQQNLGDQLRLLFCAPAPSPFRSRKNLTRPFSTSLSASLRTSYPASDCTATRAAQQRFHLHAKAKRMIATAFLKALIHAVPYAIHTVLTDNGIQFFDLPRHRSGPPAQWRTHAFDLLCQAHGIERRLTKLNHPWTNGQVERMNRTLREATVSRYHYETHDQLKRHLADFFLARNFVKRLKTLHGLTPFEYVYKIWTHSPERFRLDPTHHTPRLNTWA